MSVVACAPSLQVTSRTWLWSSHQQLPKISSSFPIQRQIVSTRCAVTHWHATLDLVPMAVSYIRLVSPCLVDSCFRATVRGAALLGYLPWNTRFSTCQHLAAAPTAEGFLHVPSSHCFLFGCASLFLRQLHSHLRCIWSIKQHLDVFMYDVFMLTLLFYLMPESCPHPVVMFCSQLPHMCMLIEENE